MKTGERLALVAAEARRLAAVEAAPRQPLSAQFEISSHVRRAAARWPTYERVSDYGHRVDAMCACEQSVAVLRRNGQDVHYDDDQIEGLVLAHLMQRHGWTRETIGD